MLAGQLAASLPLLLGEREFVNWDDQVTFEQTHGWKGLGADNIRWALVSQRCDKPTAHPAPGLPSADAPRARPPARPHLWARHLLSQALPPPARPAPPSTSRSRGSSRGSNSPPSAKTQRDSSSSPRSATAWRARPRAASSHTFSACRPATLLWRLSSRIKTSCFRSPAKKQATLLLYETLLLLLRLAPHLFLPAPAPQRRAELSAAAAALLFGAHPLRVEVTAWCSCQPYALAGLLVSAALHAHARARASGGAAWGALSVLLFLGAVASKAAAVPAALLHFALEAVVFSGGRPEGAARAPALVRRIPFPCIPTPCAPNRQLV